MNELDNRKSALEDLHKAGGIVTALNAKSVVELPESSKTRWSWSAVPEPIADEKISNTIECDILVLGFGSAGAPAALYAASHGASTVVMTKKGVVEANGAYVGIWNSRHDAEFGITYDPVYWRNYIAHCTDGRGNPLVTGRIIDKSGEAIDWLLDYMSEDAIPYKLLADGKNQKHLIAYFPDPATGDESRLSIYRGFVKYMKAVAKKTADLGGQILYHTPAVQLITDSEGAVTGAVGQNKKDGTYVKVMAKKGVLLATGDISNDPEMMECFVPQMATCRSRNPYRSCTGDGHKMAMWIGADMDVAPFTLGQAYPHDFEGKVWPCGFTVTPWLRVNKNGERYCNENIGNHEKFADVPLNTADSLQPDHVFWQICDANYSKLLDGNAKKAEMFQKCLNYASIKCANTIEELAEIIGVPVKRLKKTIERYNEICESGQDVDYGVEAEILAKTAIKTAPFYALPSMVMNTATEGGVKVNEKLQVLNRKQQVIQGLWAAGTCMGGRYGYAYPWEEMLASNKMAAMSAGICSVKTMLEK